MRNAISNIHQKDDDQEKTKGNLHICANVPKIIHFAKFVSFRRTSRFLVKSNIHKQQHNQHQGKSYESSCICIPQVNHNLTSFPFPNFLSLYAISKDTIPANISPVKTKKLKGDLKPEKLGIIKIAPNQPAAKLTKNSEEIKNQIGSILVT